MHLDIPFILIQHIKGEITNVPRGAGLFLFTAVLDEVMRSKEGCLQASSVLYI